MEWGRDHVRAATFDWADPRRESDWLTDRPSWPSPPNRAVAIDSVHDSRRHSLKQDAEKARQLRSRIAQTQRVRLRPFARCGLAERSVSVSCKAPPS